MTIEDLARKIAETITPGHPNFDPLFVDDLEALVVERLRAEEPLNEALKAYIELMKEQGKEVE